MRKFLLLGAKLFLILIIINVLLYYWIGSAQDSRFYNYYSILDELDKKHYKYLVTGDSHANDCWYHSSNPNILDFTFPGDNQVDIKRKISFLKQNNITYDVHIYEIDAQVLSTYRESTNNNDLSTLYNGSLIGIKIRKLMPLFFNPRTWSEMINRISSSQVEPDLRFNDYIDTSGMEFRAKEQFTKEKFSDNMLDILTSNIKNTLDQNAKISLVHYPFYEGYLSLIEKSKTYTQAKIATKKLANSFDLDLYDYTSLICKPDNFSNQDHLNSNGAEIFIEHFFKNFKEGFKHQHCIDQTN